MHSETRWAALWECVDWHNKNARLCLEVYKDNPRVSEEDRNRAYVAHQHHAASAAAFANKISDERVRQNGS